MESNESECWHTPHGVFTWLLFPIQPQAYFIPQGDSCVQWLVLVWCGGGHMSVECDIWEIYVW